MAHYRRSSSQAIWKIRRGFRLALCFGTLLIRDKAGTRLPARHGTGSNLNKGVTFKYETYI
ncbi:MAG: hypothetical protein WBV31_10160, partial [Terriglobales bacterium]